MELDPESRLERFEALLQPATDVHDAFEEFAGGDVGEVDVDVHAKVGFGGIDFRPPLIAAGAYVELNLVAWQRVSGRAPPRRQVIGIGEGSVDELPRRVEHTRDDQLRSFGVHSSSLGLSAIRSVAGPAACTAARWASRRVRDESQNRR